MIISTSLVIVGEIEIANTKEKDAERNVTGIINRTRAFEGSKAVTTTPI